MIKIKKQKKQVRLITAALPYINNVPHLGHIVGSHLPADIFARFCRTRGYETIFIGGTDENGSTSEIAAESIKVDINRFSDRLYAEHKKIYDWFNISYDNFSRTSNPLHHKTVQEFFKVLYDKGYITPGEMKVFYSPKEKRFLPDRYIKGTCPKCNYEEANGDQCEKCTAVINPAQLINPRSSITGDKLELRNAKHLFLRLDKISDKLEDWINNQKTWRSQVSALAKSWIKEGLKERCITRDLKHGVKVPLKEFSDKVLYVWFEAPIGYLSATKEATKDWENFWANKDARIYNFLGKDNIPFHTIFWPSMLLMHSKLNMPYNVIGLQYLNYEGQKFSKSKKIGVFCEKLPETGIDPDLMRGYLTTVIPETADSEFKWDTFKTNINSDIIDNYGNLINRTLSFINSKLDGKVKKPSKLNDLDLKLYEITEKKAALITDLIEKAQLKGAFSEILSLSTEGNKYFNETEPWKLINSDKKRASEVLYNCAELCRILSILTSPYMPSSSQKVWEQLNLKGKADEPGNWDSAAKPGYIKEYKVNKPKILFNKLDDAYLAKLKKIVSNIKDIKELFK